MHKNQLVVLCTCPDPKSAETIATTLVEERLAACVNLVPGLTSIYSWQGSLRREPECLLLIKTTAARFEALCSRLRVIHPFEVPEIIGLPISHGDPAYLQWLSENTRLP
ncbi:MAG TPA: divalent-cation tolerance protein CutA [Gammaproteobacteria bacterium]|nr:divalent-cation tolerance protein CutA [Gammaproteobacteria bacterium]